MGSCWKSVECFSKMTAAAPCEVHGRDFYYSAMHRSCFSPCYSILPRSTDCQCGPPNIDATPFLFESIFPFFFLFLLLLSRCDFGSLLLHHHHLVVPAVVPVYFDTGWLSKRLASHTIHHLYRPLVRPSVRPPARPTTRPTQGETGWPLTSVVLLAYTTRRYCDNGWRFLPSGGKKKKKKKKLAADQLIRYEKMNSAGIDYRSFELLLSPLSRVVSLWSGAHRLMVQWHFHRWDRTEKRGRDTLLLLSSLSYKATSAWLACYSIIYISIDWNCL